MTVASGDRRRVAEAARMMLEHQPGPLSPDRIREIVAAL
jgi:hypothetical protein